MKITIRLNDGTTEETEFQGLRVDRKGVYVTDAWGESICGFSLSDCIGLEVVLGESYAGATPETHGDASRG